MESEGARALLIGGAVEQAEFRTRPAELLKQLAVEVQCFPTPGDLLDAFCSQGDLLGRNRRTLLVVDQRGRAEILWTWLSLLAHLDFGPVILLVDEVDAEIERRCQRSGVLRCIEERHLARHPGLLVRVARRALERDRPLVPAGAGS